MAYCPTENPVCVQFYLAKEEKELFKRVCRIRDTTMSREIRRMVMDYSREDYKIGRLYYAQVAEN